MLVNFGIQTVINAVALWVAAWAVPGIGFGRDGGAGRIILTILLVSLIFTAVNAIVKPLVKLISLPLIILTLGLFLFIINALMLQFTSWLAGRFNLAFNVDEFWWDAVLGSLIITFMSMLLGFLKRD